ncbi:MAG: hypothetical protein A2527_00080 [Candidatus Lambdaproteobacteria bacterium RIFOXYD2_FULL_50_16]|uniref:Protein kinase domain-containing protein n=1 Tax=Candidatus Lambdaproteobacteria bacterium RIFOXYD2_FULL_50_16 TaxID=1817772 RepID=A0A1F6GFM1_9PROT|nr:MAG: hypothetical protein A2527_00080 [Candidatus Lambdaproteobacteria bacterium RIFOXYD2_FULL_50_16]
MGSMSKISEFPDFSLTFSHSYAQVLNAKSSGGLIKLVELAAVTPEALYIAQSFEPTPSLPHLVVPDQIQLGDKEVLFLYENCPYQFLPQLLDGPVELTRFFDYAISATEALQEIHRLNLLHKDLTPFNILVAPHTNQCYLTGLFLKNQENLIPEDLSPFHPLAEAFVYHSPEQTGRINRAVDKTSDLYSLGAIFFELLTGHPPFTSNDQLELIHSHIAISPTHPHGERPEVPEVVDKIVYKLLAKTAQERYETTENLLIDLKNCQTRFLESGLIEDFEIDDRRLVKRFQMPQGLYGIARHKKLLEESFAHVLAGGVEAVHIKGAAGLGKSSLVELLKVRVQAEGAILIEGRFEKQHRDTPYYGLKEALNQLVNQLLALEEKALEHWRQLIKSELGDDLVLVSELVSDLKLLIQPAPSSDPLEPIETEGRINRAVQKFLTCFIKDKKPLVIFLDNFHSADSASLSALQNFVTDVNSRHVMLLTAFRENLAEQSANLKLFFDAIAHSGVISQETKVRPLGIRDLKDMFSEAFDSKQDFGELTKMFLQKTNGNPFFVKQLLSLLIERGLITYNETKQLWQWDLKQINKEALSNDVIELLGNKIKNLPEQSVVVVKTAACIGTEFELKTLSLALGWSLEQVWAALKAPLHKGMVIEESRPHATGVFHFLHDRVHKAALSLWESGGRRQCHFTIGKQLLENRPTPEGEDWVYKTVAQLNQAVELVTNPKDRQQLAQLNLTAGNLARGRAAYDTAWEYYMRGTELLDDSNWETDYQLIKELYVRRAEAEYYTGNTEAFKPIFNILYDHLKTDQEREEVINIKLNLFIKAGDLKQALEVGVESINRFSKEPIPPNEAEVHIVIQVKMAELQARLGAQKIETLPFLKEMEGPGDQALMKLISNLIPAASLARRSLWIYLTLKMVETSLNQGNSQSSAFGYMNFAVLLCSGLEDYQRGHAMGRMAIELNRRFKNRLDSSKLNFLFYAYINHWKTSATESIVGLEGAVSLGNRIGDLIGAASAVEFLLFTHILAGTPLDGLAMEVSKHDDFAHQVGNPDLEHMMVMTKLFLGLADPNYQLTTAPDQPLEDALRSSRNQMPLQWYYLIQAQLHYFMGDQPQAMQLILKSDRLIFNYGQLSVPEHYFYYSMIVLANYPNLSSEERKRYWDILKGNRDKLAKLAIACPINFNDRYLLVCAEMSAVSGNFLEAINLFDQAIDAAISQDRTHILALAFERAARYYLSKNKPIIARAYLGEAQVNYIRWGAKAKLEQLAAELGPYLNQNYAQQAPSSQNKTETFDITTLSRTQETLSLEFDQARLIQKMLKVLLENAGAQKGFFLLNQKLNYIVRAQGFMGQDPPVKLCSIKFEECQGLSKAVVSYATRTSKIVAIDDARVDSLFAFDPYVKTEKPKSILALPVINHGKTLGLLYLENNLATHAFSKQRVEFLKLLIAQVAISLENSSLYASLAQTTEELRSSKLELEKRIDQLQRQLAIK